MKKKKLLITTDSFAPRIDGVSRFITEIIPYLTDYFDITILAPDYTQQFKKEKISKIKNVKIRLIPLSGLRFGEYRAAKFKFFKVMEEVKKNDIILVKGSNAMKMNKIVERLKIKD